MRHRAFIVSRRLVGLTAAVVLAACGPGVASRARRAPAFTFDHGIEQFETSNGMRFALVRDPRTNLATVDLRYDVGAAADPPGLAGMAHLVEHVRFELRAAPGEPTIGEQLRELTLDSNASTSWDETHYTTTVAAEHLDRVLALEGQRMRASCEQLDEAVFARERDVVLAEEAQRSSPSTRLLQQLNTIVYGPDHPYARKVGSSEIARATRADVCAFMAAHYAPHAASLVVTGPFEVDAVRVTIGRAFEPIPRRATTAPAPVTAPTLAGGVSRGVAAITRPTALVLFSYPRWGSRGALPAVLAARLLAQELAEADQEQPYIVETGVTVLGGPRAPVLAAVVEVDAAARLDLAADEVFRRVDNLRWYRDDDVTPALSQIVLGQMVRWDDLLTRGSWIADFLQYADHDQFMLEDLRAAAEGWDLHKKAVVAAMRPEHTRVLLLDTKARTGGGRVVDARSTGSHDLVPWRPAIDPAEADHPLTVERAPLPIAVEQYQLANGLSVELAPDPASPIVDARLVFPVGTAHQPPDQPLVAIAAATLLRVPRRAQPGAGPYVRPPGLGAVTSDVDVDETSTTFSIRGLAEASTYFLGRLAVRLEDGTYDDDTLRAVKRAARAHGAEGGDAAADLELARELQFRERLFGAGHPYATVTDSYEPALRNLDATRLEAWKEQHYRARGATLIVSGHFDADDVKAQIDAGFGGWSGRDADALPEVPRARPAAGPSWLAVEEPPATQLGVRLGFAAGSDAVRDRSARAVLAAMVLDQVRDVREGLGATYGIHDEYIGGVAGSALLIHGAINADQSAAAVPRLLVAVDQLRDDDAIRRAAFVRARRRVLTQVEARVAGASTMARLLAGAAARGEGKGELDRQAGEVAGLTFAEISRVARLDLERGRLVLELRGRRATVGDGFAALAVVPVWSDAPEPVTPAVVTAAATTTAPPTTESAPPAPTPRRPVPGPTVAELIARRELEANRLTVHRHGLYRGEVELSLDAFLEATGHRDQVERMHTRRTVRIGLVTGGALALATGGIVALTTESCAAHAFGSPELDACEGRARDRRILGAGFVVAGAVATLVGLELSNLRPSSSKLSKYADEENARRRRALTHTASGGTALRLSPSVAEDGAGLVLDGRF